MRALSISELLGVWERGYAQRPAQRALALVTAAEDGTDMSALPLGERDARILALREATFGTTLETLATCAACGETMDVRLDTSDVRAPRIPGDDAQRTSRIFEQGGVRVAYRLPTSGDVAMLNPAEGLDAARARLEAACIVGAWSNDDPIAPASLPIAIRTAVAEAMAEADPQADVELAMACPACAHANVVPFDVAAFFWDELNSWAKRMLRDVHALALAYGWSEKDILAMTPFRRQVYLEMVGA